MKKKVLIAEDDKAITEVVTIVLENEDIEVMVAAKEVDILNTLQENVPDVLLLDRWLFGQDGSKIAKKIKSQKDFKHIPIIFMSADSDGERISKECHADDFLSKPFNITDLVKMVKKQMKR